MPQCPMILLRWERAGDTCSAAGACVKGAAFDDNGNDADDDGAGCSPWEQRRARLEAEQAARDTQLREFQRLHWLEVKAAAARNKQQVCGFEGGGSWASLQSHTALQQQGATSAGCAG